jgi:ATP-dependent Clp protease ATP-binding subunit ClpA
MNDYPFTDRARQVMQLANQEAKRFNHEYIGTEHILLGLVQEGTGVAAHVLKNLGVDLYQIRMEAEKIVETGPDRVSMKRLPMTPRAKKVIEYSMEEARHLNHNHVGTEHILLGLLREQEGVAAHVLMNLGLKLEDVRKEVLNFLGQESREAETNISLERLDQHEQITKPAREALLLAQKYAQLLRHAAIDTEHLLLGLAEEGTGIAAKVFESLGIDMREISQRVEQLVQPGPDQAGASDALPLSPRAQRVVQQAAREARGFDQSHLCTEHLLLGLFHERDGIAYQVLSGLGLNADDIRERIWDLLGPSLAGKTGSRLGRTPWHEKLTARAGTVLSLAQEEARRLNHEYVGTEHLLLVLTRSSRSAAAAVFEHLRIDRLAVHAEVEKIAAPLPTREPEPTLPTSPLARRVLQYAFEEALALDQPLIGTDHILLGLLRADQGVAAHVLTHLGMHTDEIRDLLRKGLPGTKPDESTQPDE